ncbi:FAD-binding protein [Aliishimia ponticola]|uniref:FAD-binding protein n=1 Tax=Aliishimia ponticola TaxID=2499833 RepID=UPI001B3B5FD5|nr:FAD-binding protein [Aliishimia ponticola]
MRPEAEAELAEVIAAAEGPLAIQGGGTRGVALDGAALSTAGLSGVTLYEPGALTLVAQAGTPVAEIERVLEGEGQRLAFEPMDHRALLGTTGDPTIGGVIAANVSGPRRVQVGAARDFALGVRYVDGTGQVIKNGGRVMKNVTGYDLVKLLSGSWGSLGVLSEVSLKVLPVPETEATLTLSVASPETAVAAMSAAFGSPYDVTGAAWAQGAVSIRLEGFAPSLAYRAERLTQALATYGEITLLEAEDSAARWAEIRDVEAFANMQGDVWRVSVKPSDGPAVIAAAGQGTAMLDWGGGLVWLCLPEGTDLRAALTGIAGHAQLVRGRGFPRFQPEPPEVAALSTALRAKFDPRGILNPGVMG